MKKRERSIVSLILGVCLICSIFGVVVIADATNDTIYVPAPTGIPETDWYNIQTALDNAMPGNMIMLAAGEYYVHKPLVADGFSGILKGAGKDVTTIEVSKASDGALFPAIRIDAWDGWEEFSVPAGWQFFTTTLAYFGACENSVVISDLTMIMDGEDLTAYSYLYDPATGQKVYILEEEWGKNIAYAFIVDIAEGCDTTLERVGLIGANDGTNFQPVSPNHGFYITAALLSGDDDCGTHTAINCDFVGMGSNAYQLTGLRNGEVIIDSCLFRDCCSGVMPIYCDRMDITVTNCLFQNMFHAGVRLYGVSGHVADISHNTMIDSGGVWVGAVPINPFTYLPYEKCYLNFQHNDINLRQYGEWAGLEIWNYVDEDNWADLVFKSNKIHSVGAGLYGPIFTVNAHRALITSNIITGSGPAAMYIGVATWEGANDRGLMIYGNNLEGWTVDGGPFEPYWHGEAPYWLGEDTSYCTIIGHTEGMVADYGSNNSW